MRKKLIAGNWKMNLGPVSAVGLLKDLNQALENQSVSSEVVVCPPYVSLHQAVSELQTSPVSVGAQNVHYEASGAYTGEVSPQMLKEAGCSYVIVGHSERREYFSEDDELVARKVKSALKEGLNVILCVGETLEQRKSGDQERVVTRQLKAVTDQLDADLASRLVIAYEPVWAIGTGETATPEQAQEMHAHIRSRIASSLGEELSTSIRILYGGSMKPANADDLLGQPDVDGGLIGGASLDADSFVKIVEIAEKITSS